MDPIPIVNLGPLLQYGFAGFALIQFGAFLWLGVKGLGVLTDLRDVIGVNAAAMAATKDELADVREEIRGQPCRMTIEQLAALVKRLQPQGG